jgi:hypothetical protein
MNPIARAGVGGGIGATLGQILGFPRQALVEPLLGALGLPKNAQELAPQKDDDSTLSTVLKSLAGTGFEMATDPLTYAGGILGKAGRLGLGGAAKAAETMGPAEKISQINRIGKTLDLGTGLARPADSASSLVGTHQRAMTGGNPADIAAHQAYYETQAPSKLKQLLEAVRNPKTYSRATPGAQDLLESTGMGFKTDQGMQMMGLNTPTNLVKGRGGVLMTPQEQYLSMKQNTGM